MLGTGPVSGCRSAAVRCAIGWCIPATTVNKAKLQAQRSITVLGIGQSAAEIFYDLLSDIDQYDYQLNWITRAPRFYPLEYTGLTLEMTSPEWIDYFHALPPDKRDQLNASHKTCLKASTAA